MTTRSTDTRLPLWLRIVAFAVENADARTGVCLAKPRALRDALSKPGQALAAAQLTRAIQTAVKYGLLQDGSSTRVLVLTPGSLTVCVVPDLQAQR